MANPNEVYRENTEDEYQLTGNYCQKIPSFVIDHIFSVVNYLNAARAPVILQQVIMIDDKITSLDAMHLLQGALINIIFMRLCFF